MKIAIVGNAEIWPEARNRINNCEYVIRINKPPASHFSADTKTSELMLANSSKQIFELASDLSFLASPAFAHAAQITMAFDDRIIARFMPERSLMSRLRDKRTNSARHRQALCEQYGKSCRTMPADLCYRALDVLKIEATENKAAIPSTGFLAILNAVENATVEHEIVVFGFTHQGWKRHK